MTEFQWVYVEIVRTSLRMGVVARWLAENHDTIDERTTLIIGAMTTQIARYADTIVPIVRNPTVQQPIRGRCIFY